VPSTIRANYCHVDELFSAYLTEEREPCAAAEPMSMRIRCRQRVGRVGVSPRPQSLSYEPAQATPLPRS